MELLEHKDKQKQLRNETRYFEKGNPFKKNTDETMLLKFLLEILTKSNGILNMPSADKHQNQSEELRILEMSLNKNDVMCK